jgi:hypothetical protein
MTTNEGERFSQTAKLPFGYTVTLSCRIVDGKALDQEFEWDPNVPRLEGRAKEEFLIAYRAARRAFFTEVANKIGGAIVVVDMDGKYEAIQPCKKPEADAPWTTRIDTRLPNAPEVHTVCFAPVGWPGQGPTIGLGIPECELQYCRVGLDGEPVAFVNRPQTNKNVHHWLDVVCQTASEERLFVMLHCNTPQQTKKAAKYATRKLPQHRRVALERMYDPQTRREPEKMD